MHFVHIFPKYAFIGAGLLERRYVLIRVARYNRTRVIIGRFLLVSVRSLIKNHVVPTVFSYFLVINRAESERASERGRQK